MHSCADYRASASPMSTIFSTLRLTFQSGLGSLQAPTSNQSTELGQEPTCPDPLRCIDSTTAGKLLYFLLQGSCLPNIN